MMKFKTGKRDKKQETLRVLFGAVVPLFQILIIGISILFRSSSVAVYLLLRRMEISNFEFIGSHA